MLIKKVIITSIMCVMLVSTENCFCRAGLTLGSRVSSIKAPKINTSKKDNLIVRNKTVGEKYGASSMLGISASLTPLQKIYHSLISSFNTVNKLLSNAEVKFRDKLSEASNCSIGVYDLINKNLALLKECIDDIDNTKERIRLDIVALSKLTKDKKVALYEEQMLGSIAMLVAKIDNAIMLQNSVASSLFSRLKDGEKKKDCSVIKILSGKEISNFQSIKKSFENADDAIKIAVEEIESKIGQNITDEGKENIKILTNALIKELSLHKIIESFLACCSAYLDGNKEAFYKMSDVLHKVGDKLEDEKYVSIKNVSDKSIGLSSNSSKASIKKSSSIHNLSNISKRNSFDDKYIGDNKSSGFLSNASKASIKRSNSKNKIMDMSDIDYVIEDDEDDDREISNISRATSANNSKADMNIRKGNIIKDRYYNMETLNGTRYSMVPRVNNSKASMNSKRSITEDDDDVEYQNATMDNIGIRRNSSNIIGSRVSNRSIRI